MSRRSLIVGVWKEKLTLNESIVAAEAIYAETKASEWPFTIALAPNPFCYAGVVNAIPREHIHMCAQNVMWDAISGSFIGQTTTKMLNEVGCDYVIVGHSESRGHFFESNEMIADRTVAAIGADICPILCIGEDTDSKEAGSSEEVLRTQLTTVFAKLGETGKLGNLIIAYEPVWAISTSRSAFPLPTGPEVQIIHAHIRRLLREISPDKHFADRLTLLYGGSVSGKNAEEYLAQPDVDGALVGGASKTPKDFLATLRAARRAFEPDDPSRKASSVQSPEPRPR